ncbi:MAG TPA: hypothetical protein EYH09_01255 [Candidatus Nanopusillus sp.]|nr:hypothetical protein [Candidatus Nanopusillus sp.]HIP90174.1 hypothetical protein [Candidatus Nanopusillus sp.]
MRFLELRYIAYIKETNQIFDYSERPIVVPVGKGLLYTFLEKALQDVEPGKHYRFEFVKPFGERKDELIKIIPLSEFIRRGIRPSPGLIVNVDGRKGIILSISGGRVIVDFNHPVAGKDLIYEVEVIREVKDLKDKIKGLLSFLFGVDRENITVNIDNKNIKISINGKELPQEYKDLLRRIIDELKNYNL